MIFLDVDDLLVIATRVVGDDVAVRDSGLVASAAARPMTTVFGQDAYPGLHRKTAALMHSIAQNHALVDDNKRLCLAAAIVFLGINGWRLTLDNDGAYELVMAIASGTLRDVDEITDRLVAGSEPA